MVKKSSMAPPSPAAPVRAQRSGGILSSVAQGISGLVDKVTPEGEATTLALGEETGKETRAPAAEAEPPRADFPEVLFYGLVPVGDHEQVIIPLGDSLGTFTVEAFVLDGGDWTAAKSTVVVDQPVRVDLEVPPAVHVHDRVFGRVRIATSSGRALASLTCDGGAVLLRHQHQNQIIFHRRSARLYRRIWMDSLLWCISMRSRGRIRS